MSAADYYGGHPSQHQTQHSHYAAPQQQQYASSSAPYSGYAPPTQQPYASGASQPYDNRQPGQPQDGEKGLMATVIGGGAGGAIGHKMSHGSKFKTLLGGAAGVAVANAIEHKIKGKKQPSHGHHHAPPPQHHGHHGGHGGSFAGLLPSSGHNGGSMGGLGGLLGGKQNHGHQSHHHGPRW